jgi:diguanylate cyclase (GGDEF)-like protein
MNKYAPDYIRVVRTASFMWIVYLAALAVLDGVIYSGKPSTPTVTWYHVMNLTPALFLLWLSHSKNSRINTWHGTLLTILIVSIVPILVNTLIAHQLPPAPLTNTEGLTLRLLPVLLIGLILIAWRHNALVMIIYTLVTNLLELCLVLLLNRFEDPRYFSFTFIIIIRTVCFIVVGIFISQLIHQLRTQAVRDSLTGLYNRHYLNEILGEYIARAERERTILTLVILDLDHFKHFNDTYGHLAGDAVLRSMGRFLEKNIRRGDVACRFGGEEFLLVMPGASLEHALARTDQLRCSLEQAHFAYAGRHLNVTCSAGVASYPLNGTTIECVLQAADKALYTAKQAGRNCVMCAAYSIASLPVEQPV